MPSAMGTVSSSRSWTSNAGIGSDSARSGDIAANIRPRNGMVTPASRHDSPVSVTDSAGEARAQVAVGVRNPADRTRGNQEQGREDLGRWTRTPTPGRRRSAARRQLGRRDRRSPAPAGAEANEVPPDVRSMPTAASRSTVEYRHAYVDECLHGSPAERELEPGLARIARPAADGGRRGTEGAGDVVLVGQVARERRQRPAADAARAELRGSHPAAPYGRCRWMLSLNGVKNTVALRPWRRRGSDRRARVADRAAPLDPQAAGPFRRVAQAVAGDVAGDAADTHGARYRSYCASSHARWPPASIGRREPRRRLPIRSRGWLPSPHSRCR